MDNINRKIHLLELTFDELARSLLDIGIEKYRAKQIFDWIYHKRITNFEQMSNLSKSLRLRLADIFYILQAQISAHKISRDKTEKLLLQFEDKLLAETVLIPFGSRLTACLSTQSGCPVACQFCATGQGEYAGNLSAGQIVEQLLQLQIRADIYGKRINHIVFMGMGEPLLNYENTLKAIKIINSPESFNIGARKITISTVGIPEKILALARENMQFTLAISLHHTEQNQREKLIPLAKRYSIEQIISSAREYFNITGREITLEYLLLADINCSRNDARRLANIAKQLRANVNLIAYNRTSDMKFASPSKAHINDFIKWLKDASVNVHLRASKGADIEAACGQLKNNYV